MQIKGDEFIKKVQLQQERDELEKKLSELEEVETSMKNESVIMETSMQTDEHELDNIMLETSNSNEDNKKKYLVLGIVLVVLFLLTIIIIRLLTDDSSKKDQFTSKQADSLEMKKIEENSNIEENFQKIINDRIKKDSTETPTQNTPVTSEEKVEALPVVAEEPAVKEEPTITNETMDETIKKIETKIEQKKEVVKKEIVEEKVEPKKSIKDLVKSSSNEMTKGYFIQIGAFTKKPSSSYINNIRNANLKYKIYQVEVKGTLYNKVLIGPYSSRAVANENIDDIKKKLKLSSAYILKF